MKLPQITTEGSTRYNVMHVVELFVHIVYLCPCYYWRMEHLGVSRHLSPFKHCVSGWNTNQHRPMGGTSKENSPRPESYSQNWAWNMAGIWLEYLEKSCSRDTVTLMNKLCTDCIWIFISIGISMAAFNVWGLSVQEERIVNVWYPWPTVSDSKPTDRHRHHHHHHHHHHHKDRHIKTQIVKTYTSTRTKHNRRKVQATWTMAQPGLPRLPTTVLPPHEAVR